MIKKPAGFTPVPVMHKTGIGAGLPWEPEEIFISPGLTAQKGKILHRNARPGEKQKGLFLRQFFQEVFVPPDFSLQFPQFRLINVMLWGARTIGVYEGCRFPFCPE